MCFEVRSPGDRTWNDPRLKSRLATVGTDLLYTAPTRGLLFFSRTAATRLVEFDSRKPRENKCAERYIWTAARFSQRQEFFSLLSKLCIARDIPRWPVLSNEDPVRRARKKKKNMWLLLHRGTGEVHSKSPPHQKLPHASGAEDHRVCPPARPFVHR